MRLREQLRDEPGLAGPLLPDWLKADSGGRAHRAFDWSFQGPGVRVPGPRPSWGTLEAGIRGGYVCGQHRRALAAARRCVAGL